LEVLIPGWGRPAEQPSATYALRPSGESFPIEATLSTTTYEAERLTTVIVRDITDRKRVEDERLQLLASERSARAQAEAALHQRDEFLSVAAHELKTPVANLRAYAEMMLLRLDQEQPDLRRLHQVLERVGQQSEKLGRLVSQLLDLASLEAGQFKIDRKAVDLGALAQTVLEAAQSQTSRHTLQLDVQSAVIAEVDALRVEQVLTNLVDNALKYSPDGGVIAVEITAPDVGSVQLAVRDHGVGIAPEMLGGLFGRFFRAHDQDYASGLGLGLYISRQIVELHNGEIRAEFPPNGGVRMVVVLPAVVRRDARHAA
jgi:signal transduction histidine kinase